MQRFKNILLYLGTERNESAMSRGFDLAMENNASLTLMDVVKPLPRTFAMMTDTVEPDEMERLIVADHRQKLLSLASEYVDTAVPVDAVVAVGDPAVEITRQVMTNDHDLVIKTADGLSVAGQLFGSVARSLMRTCPCPVWVLKPATHGTFDRVLAAIDVEASDQQHKELNRNILEIALSIAQREHAELHVVAAWDLWMEQSLRRRAGDAEVDAALAVHQSKVRRTIDELLQAPNSTDKNIHVHLIQGTPATVIRSVVEEAAADLLVMGTVCRTSAAGFLIGNTAESVLADVDCSLLALKPSGFVSPIKADKRVADDLSKGALLL